MKPLLPISILALGYACFAPTQTKPKVNFGRDVRPILSEHCFKCHGPDVAKAAAGLRLDSFAAATAHVVIPGNPTGSPLVARISATNPEDRMPPVGPALTKDQIETLKAWIAQGAKYEKHWAFVTPVQPQLPVTKEKHWAKNPIDQFVLAKLEEANLKPEPEADRDTLAMRAAQSLTGLPPSPEELKQFRQDTKPNAYERYVDRLLAKPSYGEQEARYWLDAVRYGDTHGLQLDNERAVFPYRDWVVQAFNKDLPYNDFLKWQVAGDLLPNPNTEQLIATGYVRMNLTSDEGGAIPEEFLARNTFDRVDTTSTVLLGLTVACAKCHDHKYDPIKQSDYYGLYAYFNSTQDEPLDGNIALPPPFIEAPTSAQQSQRSIVDSRLGAFLQTVDPAKAAEWFAKNRDTNVTSRNWQISPVYPAATFDEAFDKSSPGEPGQPTASWNPFKFELGKNSENIIGKDNAAVYVRGIVAFQEARTVNFYVASDDAIKVWLNGKLIHSHKIGRGITQGADLVKGEFQKGDNELVAKVVNGISIDGLNIRFGQPKDGLIEKALTAFKANPTNDKAIKGLREMFLTNGPTTALSTEYQKFAKEKAALEQAIPKTLIAREMLSPRPTFILKRGQYDQPGDKVDRHIPDVLGNLPKGAPNNRLGLATWLTDPNNPLTARVFVNRIWQQHFGTGIVKTVEDFGSQGEWPLNQPLLDYLATNFVKNGWSVKQLNRLIVTSATFRQASKITKAKLAKDPENRLASRGPRFRLDAEAIRDKALYAGGLLLQERGGRGFKPYQPDGLWEGSSDPASSTHFYVRDHGAEIYRRSMYLFWKRTSPPPVMITFDSPLRDTCIVRRSITNTPLQALALLNEPAFLEASRSMAVRVINTATTDDQRLNTLFQVTLGRAPKPVETALLKASLGRYRQKYQANPMQATNLLNVGDAPQNKRIPAPEQASWMIVCSSVMNTDEFLTQH